MGKQTCNGDVIRTRKRLYIESVLRYLINPDLNCCTSLNELSSNSISARNPSNFVPDEDKASLIP